MVVVANDTRAHILLHSSTHLNRRLHENHRTDRERNTTEREGIYELLQVPEDRPRWN